MEAILAHLPAAYGPALRFTYITGWRFASEVRTLQWADVDIRRGTITLPAERSKSKEPRVLTYTAHPDLAAIVEGQREATLAVERLSLTLVPWLFHEEGEQLPMKYTRLWRAAATKAGLPEVLVHDLRRSAARNLSEAGVSTEVGMKILGHETPDMFRRYGIVPGDDMAAALGKLASHTRDRDEKSVAGKIG